MYIKLVNHMSHVIESFDGEHFFRFLFDDFHGSQEISKSVVSTVRRNMVVSYLDLAPYCTACSTVLPQSYSTSAHPGQHPKPIFQERGEEGRGGV